MKITSFDQAVKFLFHQIPKNNYLKFPGNLGVARTAYFLKLLGNPQDKLRVIHVAGTSGKGSTAYLISLLLGTLKFKVGLTLSPHILDIRERLQINNRLISREKFTRYLSDIIPIVEKVERSRFGKPTYFEILIILAFYAFYKEKVDFAVVETGLGGLLDATNTIARADKLVVLTRIGLDHTHVLGKTIGDIAVQKSGIIQKGNTVVSVWQETCARKIIEKKTEEKQARLFYIKRGVNFKNEKTTSSDTCFDFSFAGQKQKNIRLGLLGFHQAENCSLAVASVMLLVKKFGSSHRFKLVRSVLAGTRFVGRFDQVKINGKTIILDGAHNPQKMASFTKSLAVVFPGKKHDFLLAFKSGKDWKSMLREIIPFAREIAVTGFFTQDQDLHHFCESPEKIIKFVKKLGFSNCEIFKDAKAAIENFLADKKKNKLVVTGSLYFLSDIYKELHIC